MKLEERGEEFILSLFRALTEKHSYDHFHLSGDDIKIRPPSEDPKDNRLSSLGGIEFKVISSRPLWLSIEYVTPGSVSLFVTVRNPNITTVRAAIGPVFISDLSQRLKRLMDSIMSDGDEKL